MLQEGVPGEGPVVYWMRRDLRAEDNWALLAARDLAKERRVPLGVLFCLVSRYLGACGRQYGFMLRGLEELAEKLEKLGIPFFLLTGEPGRAIPEFLARHRAGALVTDFSPLRLVRGWNDRVRRRIDIPFYEVDAHNVLPCWEASPKQEYAARTMRPKIHRRLSEFLDPFPSPRRHAWRWPGKVPAVSWQKAARTLRVSATVGEVAWLEPGEKAARRVLKTFLHERLARYEPGRNDPTQGAQSNLSPYLHFGQISAQRVALETLRWTGDMACRDAFLEELIVRRELADNFCYYNERYDAVDGFPAWALRTLERHAGDPRVYVYTRGQFERARTHDALWNAAQLEMVLTGKMHGYLRMYWAKKILEWSPSPQEALRIAIDLNDKYELDGRDPNGYAGVAWSIGGVHDRPWFERPIFGTIRYMSASGCRKKFDVDRYIQHIERLGKEAGA
jgi:deoxyribodipyrimidine photo-lyase